MVWCICYYRNASRRCVGFVLLSAVLGVLALHSGEDISHSRSMQSLHNKISPSTMAT